MSVVEWLGGVVLPLGVLLLVAWGWTHPFVPRVVRIGGHWYNLDDDPHGVARP